MATDINNQLLSWARSLKNWRFFALGKQALLKDWKRRYFIWLYRNGQRAVSVDSISIRSEMFSSTNHLALERNSWHYLSTPFQDASLKQIVDNWPSINFFSPSRDYSKTYDRPGLYDHANGLRDIKLKNNLAERLLEFLADENWISHLMALRHQRHALRLANLSLAWSRTGSYLLPHKDSVGSLGDGSWLNVIFIVASDGQDPNKCGKTSFYLDNTYNRLAFTPILHGNCAVLYDTRADLFHGFEPLARQSWSWRIIAQYASTEELESLGQSAKLPAP